MHVHVSFWLSVHIQSCNSFLLQVGTKVSIVEEYNTLI